MADLPILEELRHDLREAGRRTAPAPARRRLAWRPVVALAAAGLAALFVVVVGPQGAAPPAQDGGRTIEHVVFQAYDARGNASMRSELWTTSDRCTGRGVHTRPDGDPFGEFVQTREEFRVWTPATDRITVSRSGPGLRLGVVDPLVTARAFLRDHRTTKTDPAVRDGRPTVWREARDSTLVMRYLTPADSLEVLEVQMLRRGRVMHRVKLVSREQVPYDPALLTMSEHPGAQVERLRVRPAPQVHGGEPRC